MGQCYSNSNEDNTSQVNIWENVNEEGKIDVYKQMYVPPPPEARKYAQFHKYDQSNEVRAQLEKRKLRTILGDGIGLVDDSKSVNII